MMFGGTTHLKWKEPRVLLRYHERELSLPRRLWDRHGISFLLGLFLGIITIVGIGLPETLSELLADLTLVLGFGLFIALVYGIVGLMSPRVYLNENAVTRVHGENQQRWDYAGLVQYEISEVRAGEQTVRVLTLYGRGGEIVELEVADDVSNREIERILGSRIGAIPATEHVIGTEPLVYRSKWGWRLFMLLVSISMLVLALYVGAAGIRDGDYATAFILSLPVLVFSIAGLVSTLRSRIVLYPDRIERIEFHRRAIRFSLVERIEECTDGRIVIHSPSKSIEITRDVNGLRELVESVRQRVAAAQQGVQDKLSAV